MHASFLPGAQTPLQELDSSLKQTTKVVHIQITSPFDGQDRRSWSTHEQVVCSSHAPDSNVCSYFIGDSSMIIWLMSQHWKQGQGVIYQAGCMALELHAIAHTAAEAPHRALKGKVGQCRFSAQTLNS